MKIRDAIFLVIGGLLVISGMVLNSVLVTDADAQDRTKHAVFNEVKCNRLVVGDGDKRCILTPSRCLFLGGGEILFYGGGRIEMMRGIVEKEGGKYDGHKSIKLLYDEYNCGLFIENEHGYDVATLFLSDYGAGGVYGDGVLSLRDKSGRDKFQK